jgi:hypothetical protein
MFSVAPKPFRNHGAPHFRGTEAAVITFVLVGTAGTSNLMM